MTIQSLIATPGAAWLAFAALLAIIELLVPGIFLVFVAAGAVATGLVTFLIPGLSLWVQIVIFALASASAVMLGRSWYARNPVESTDPLLNDRVARLIGQVVTVAEAIEAGHGKVRVGDSEWLATGPDSAVGSHVRIIGADGTSLVVEPA